MVKPTAHQVSALQQLRRVFDDTQMPALFSSSVPSHACTAANVDPDLTRRRKGLFRFFCLGESIECDAAAELCTLETIEVLEKAGILRRRENCISTGEYRLVYHLGLFLFCHRSSPRALFYYGTDSIALSRMLSPVSGTVLDLCAGVGAQALFCARTASSVTAVELERSAEPIFWINSSLNGLTENIVFLSGDLFKPVPVGRFDRICANPPFLPVPPSIRFPLYAGGGSDGLDIVRRVLQGLPDYLATNGECHIIASALGDGGGPDVRTLKNLPVSTNLKMQLSCYSYEELTEDTVALFAASALDCGGPGDAREEYRRHFRQLEATHLYYFVLRAKLA